MCHRHSRHLDRKIEVRNIFAQLFLTTIFLSKSVRLALLALVFLTAPAIPARLCRYSDAELFGFVKAVRSVRGAVTINVPIDLQRGLIPANSHAQLVRLPFPRRVVKNFTSTLHTMTTTPTHSQTPPVKIMGV